MLARLIFARQSLVALPPLTMSRDDRLAPIVEQLVAAGWSFEAVWHETPDTNEGKALAGLIKALTRPLESALRKRGGLRRKAGGRRLHLFWTDGDCVQLGMSFLATAASCRAAFAVCASRRSAEPLDAEA